MELDTDLFPIGMVELMERKVLVHMDQAETTKGKNVFVSDELRNRIISILLTRLRLQAETTH
jgi:hypothetical protein